MYTSITPVLSVVTDKGFQPNINPEEVATAFHLPLQRFLRSGMQSEFEECQNILHVAMIDIARCS